jgi:hypothetical protein
MNAIVRFFGLKGSWKWACRQMDKGEEVRFKGASGCVRYRLDPENQRRLQWWFGKWENAFFFLSYQEGTDWELVGSRTWVRRKGYVHNKEITEPTQEPS